MGVITSCKPMGPSLPVLTLSPPACRGCPYELWLQGIPWRPCSVSPTPLPRPLKNASDGALMDDNQNEWGDEDLETKKFRVSAAGSQASLGGSSHLVPE